ncbi:MAG: hypothetical protein Fur005_15240 [Roseiflexaceae bacterium]
MPKRLLFFVVLMIAILPVQPVSAHATLVRADPPIGATLASAPSQVVLEFAEPVDPALSEFRLFDRQNRRIEIPPFQIDPADPLVVRLPMPSLSNGAYTVLWRVRSLTDGHVSEGSLPFGIGEAAPTFSLIPPPGSPDPATRLPNPFESLARWLGLLATILSFGSAVFLLAIWRPTYTPAFAILDRQLLAWLKRLIPIGAGLALFATILLLLVQAGQAVGGGLLAGIGAPALTILGGSVGWAWWLRLAVALALFGIAPRLTSVAERAGPWWLLAGLGALFMISQSATSHASAAATPLALLADWLHRIAMVAWIGGLIPLFILLWAARQANLGQQLSQLNHTVLRFSALSILAVVMLSLSGSASAAIQIGSFELLGATTYGRALSLKIGLFAILFLLGAVNLLRHSPRMAKGKSAIPLMRSIGIELLVAGGVLASAAVMTSVAPSQAAWAEQQQQGIANTAQVGDVGLTLRVAPAQIGNNQFAVDISDTRPGAAEAPTRVIMRFHMIGMEMGELETIAEPTAIPNRYTAQGSYMSMGGRWQVDVVLRRAGFEDAQHTFTLDVVR